MTETTEALAAERDYWRGLWERASNAAIGYHAEAVEVERRLNALVADLRALCDEDDAGSWLTPAKVRAVIDRHAPKGDAA